MDINAYLQQELQEEKMELDKHTKELDKDIENSRTWLETIKARKDFPEKTDTIEKLQKASGRKVNLEDSFGKKTTIFEFKDGRINANGISYPIIGSNRQGIKRIVDEKTKEVIFDNPYYNENITVQFGMMLGKQSAIEEVQTEINSKLMLKKYFETEFKDTKKAIEKVPTWIKQGKKFIFPQRNEKWEKCVANEAIDTYKGATIANALEIMEILANGGTVEQAKETINKAGHSGMSYSITMSIVAQFSKRGPEFFKGVKKQNPDWLQKIENENKNFARNLSDGGKQ